MDEQVMLMVCPKLMTSDSLALTNSDVHLTDGCLPDITFLVFGLYCNYLMDCFFLARVGTFSV